MNKKAHTQPKIGELISLYRRVQKIGVRELAKEIGISAATLSRVENGKEMDLKTYFNLLSWLFEGGADGEA